MGLSPRHISKKGLAMIARFEGTRSEFGPFLYNDPSGYATLGYGHLLHKSGVTKDDIRRYRNFTEADALELLRADVAKAEQAVRAVWPRVTKQPRFDALVSIVFNCGAGVLDRGHTLGDELRKKRRGDAANAFLLYDHSGGVEVPGLKARRVAERRLWVAGLYP